MATVLEYKKNQRFVLKSLIASNVDGNNEEIIREVKKQLKNQNLYHIGEVDKPKKIRKHCPACVCAGDGTNGCDSTGIAGNRESGRPRGHKRESMPGGLAARLERESDSEEGFNVAGQSTTAQEAVALHPHAVDDISSNTVAMEISVATFHSCLPVTVPLRLFVIASFHFTYFLLERLH